MLAHMLCHLFSHDTIPTFLHGMLYQPSQQQPCMSTVLCDSHGLLAKHCTVTTAYELQGHALSIGCFSAVLVTQTWHD